MMEFTVVNVTNLSIFANKNRYTLLGFTSCVLTDCLLNIYLLMTHGYIVKWNTCIMLLGRDVEGDPTGVLMT